MSRNLLQKESMALIFSCFSDAYRVGAQMYWLGNVPGILRKWDPCPDRCWEQWLTEARCQNQDFKLNVTVEQQKEPRLRRRPSLNSYSNIYRLHNFKQGAYPLSTWFLVSKNTVCNVPFLRLWWELNHIQIWLHIKYMLWIYIYIAYVKYLV